MPKLKTKYSVKKRFSVTATGTITSTQSAKRHGMTKRSKRSIRVQRGTAIMNPSDSRIVKLFMPYSR